jgi:hypothetical protein
MLNLKQNHSLTIIRNVNYRIKYIERFNAIAKAINTNTKFQYKITYLQLQDTYKLENKIHRKIYYCNNNQYNKYNNLMDTGGLL